MTGINQVDRLLRSNAVTVEWVVFLALFQLWSGRCDSMRPKYHSFPEKIGLSTAPTATSRPHAAGNRAAITHEPGAGARLLSFAAARRLYRDPPVSSLRSRECHSAPFHTQRGDTASAGFLPSARTAGPVPRRFSFLATKRAMLPRLHGSMQLEHNSLGPKFCEGALFSSPHHLKGVENVRDVAAVQPV